MGAAKTPEATPVPPEPETVKYTEAEVAKARTRAKEAAGMRYGIAGTNVTRGALASEPIDTKKKTLGGE